MISVENLFERLRASLSSEEYEHADLILAKLSKHMHIFDETNLDEYNYAQRIVEIEVHGISDYSDGDDTLFDWDGDALASAGFGVDEDY